MKRYTINIPASIMIELEQDHEPTKGEVAEEVGKYVELRLPARFYDDHAARDLPSGVVVKRLAREVDVRLDREALDDLRSDAEHYATTTGLDPDLLGLAQSAKATVRRLSGVEIPEGNE